MIAVYTRGRWAGFISPTPYAYVTFTPANGDDEHIVNIYYEGEDTLPNPQQVIGWAPESMWALMLEYVNERDEADQEKKS